jgi:xanthine dehydrogenase small subunit
MQNTISFVLDNKLATIDLSSDKELTPTTTVLNYLRGLPDHKGVKEGCAEGDCGACTVVIGELDTQNGIGYKNVDSCLVFLPMLHGRQLITVEDLTDEKGGLHPVQSAMVETGGSQCGFCTPGIVMSMFSLYKNYSRPTREQIDDAITGNLCRCTGYKPIIKAAAKACINNRIDRFTELEPEIISMLQSISKESIHIKSLEQEYFRPSNLNEALTLKAQYPYAIIISGSTDIALRVTKGHEVLKQIIDLSGIDELKQTQDTPAFLSIGSGIVLNDVQKMVQKDFPALYDMLSVFGSQQIRNLATLGGNLGTASPISDTLPVLMAYNAKIILQNSKTQREVNLDEYILGYRKTIRTQDELIVAVHLPKVQIGSIIKSYKISKRKDLDISTVSAGFRLELDKNKVRNIKLVYGGMAEMTKHATAVERFLTGKGWNRRVIEEAVPLIDKDFKPISDARGSAEFRSVVAKNLLIKFWSETQ